MAALLAPDHVQSMHESLHHFVAQSPWSDVELLRQVRGYVLPAMQQRGPVTAWIVDETSFVKKGTHSVGVIRQYCGRVGTKENCQVAVSLSVATATGSLPIAWRLYLPEEWANEAERRREAGIPEQVQFQTKPQIALAQIRQAVEDGVPPGVVLADEVYGSNREFRAGVAELKLDYSVAVRSASLYHPQPGVGRGGGLRSCAGTTRINRSPSSNWRGSCRRKLGARWRGAKAVKKSCVPVLPLCGFGRRTETIARAAYSRNSGC
jgi:SRSO17 transposase